MDRVIVVGRVDLIPRDFNVLGRDDPMQVMEDIAEWKRRNAAAWETLHPEEIRFRVHEEDPDAEYERMGWLVDDTPELREATTVLWSLDEIYLSEEEKWTRR